MADNITFGRAYRKWGDPNNGWRCMPSRHGNCWELYINGAVVARVFEWRDQVISDIPYEGRKFSTIEEAKLTLESDLVEEALLRER